MAKQNNKSKLIIGVAIVAVLVGLGAWAVAGKSVNAPESESSDSPAKTTEVETTEQPAADEQVSETIITFTAGGFSPKELEVKLGTTVTVRNDSDQRVQFSSDSHPTHTENEGMNLKVLNPGESGTFTAEPVGRHGFHDHLNDEFTGFITVTE